MNDINLIDAKKKLSKPHVSIHEIEEMGFRGDGVTLEESLVDYGLAWKYFPACNGGEICLFIFSHPSNDGTFCCDTMSDDSEEWDHFLPEVKRSIPWYYQGYDGEEFSGLTIAEKVKLFLAENPTNRVFLTNGLKFRIPELE